MEPCVLIERIKELQGEISEITAANRAYFAHRGIDPARIILHDRRRERLQEIKKELEALRRRAAA